MKTPQQIRARIKERMDSMLSHPLMWSLDSNDLETHYLSLLDLLLFTDGKDTIPAWKQWREFAHKKIGYSGVHSVSTFTKSIDELTELLRQFTISVVE